MKKKYNKILILAIIVFVASALLLVLGNKNKICLSFGIILLGVSLVLFGYSKSNDIKKMIFEVDNEMAETDINDEFQLKELYKIKKGLNKSKRRLEFVFYICGFLLFVVGAVGLF